MLVVAFPLTAFSQWYVGATVGQYDLNEDGWESAATLSSRGGYRFNDVFSLEASYTFFTETEFESNPSYTLEGGLFDVGLVAAIPLSKRFEIFGRVGYGYWAADVNESGYNSDDTGDSWNYGGGFAFNFNRNFSLIAGYQKYDFDIDFIDLKADTYYAGLKFYFDFDSSSKSKSTSGSSAAYEPQPVSVSSAQLRAVDQTEKGNCGYVKTVTAGSGGPGDPSTHTENAMNKALALVSNAGADSYYVVDVETTSTGASVILEALNCN
jgi:hypothetical protein